MPPNAPLFERRAFPTALEIRADDAGEPAQFSGHAALFGVMSEELWGFREVIAPGAFKRTLKNKADVRFLINHDPSLVLARTKSKTLTLSEDERGLLSEAELPDTSYANDLVISMKRGDIDQMSFGFQVVKDEWSTLPDGSQLRTVREAKLFDVSVVTFPAYKETDAQLRSSQQIDTLSRVLGWDELPDDEREALLSGLANHEINSDRLPALRLAQNALAELAAQADPPNQHSAALEVMLAEHRLIEQRMRFTWLSK